MKRLVATMRPPNAVSATICSGRSRAARRREELIRNPVRILSQLPAVVDDRLFPIVQPQRFGIFARVDQDPPEEGRTDEAIRPGRDGVCEERRQPLAEERHDLIAEIIPGHQRVQRDRRAGQCPLHIRGPAMRRKDLVQRSRDSLDQ